MVEIGTLKDDIKELSDFQLQELFNYIGEIMNLNSISNNLNNEFKETRFAKGEVCPHCNSNSVVKNGKLNGKQRYICKSCKKSFNDLTKSALSCTKLSLEKWIEYVKVMIIGLSIRKNAKAVGVCVKTSFYMRHKVLDFIRTFMGVGDVDGVVEIDETFIAESYKGNHKKSGFIIPRPSRKRGKQMINQAIKYAFEILNVSRVTLKVFDNNPTAHSCYQNSGFVDVKHWEKVFPYKDEMWGCYDMAIEK